MELEEKKSDFEKRGIRVAALSYDSAALLRYFAEKRKITYPLLSDPDSAIIRAFGILNESIPRSSPIHGVPHPGTYWLDHEGKVRAKYFEEDYTQRYTSGDILVKEFGAAAGAPHATVETRHLRVSTSTSTTIVRTGQRIALLADIELKPGLHLYAPGAQGYKVTQLDVSVSPALVLHDTVYPPSRTLYLKAIREKVPVYEKRVRLVREVTIGRDVKRALTAEGMMPVEGTLWYQACDAKICYNPESVPLKWIVRWEGLDSNRAPQDLQRAPRK